MLLESLINQLDNSWKNILNDFITNKNNELIINELNRIINLKNITPKQEKILNALKITSFYDVKVLIIGQDPYPEIGKANGLAFSYSNNNFSLDSSLENIFTQLNKISNRNNIFLKNRSSTNIKNWNRNLEDWAKNGIFLLNTALTTTNGKVAQFLDIWKPFTKYIILNLIKDRLHTNKKICVFLWGNPAKNLFIDAIKDIKNSYIIENKLKNNEKIIKSKNIIIFYSYHPSKIAENLAKREDLKFSKNAKEHFEKCINFLN